MFTASHAAGLRMDTRLISCCYLIKLSRVTAGKINWSSDLPKFSLVWTQIQRGLVYGCKYQVWVSISFAYTFQFRVRRPFSGENENISLIWTKSRGHEEKDGPLQLVDNLLSLFCGWLWPSSWSGAFIRVGLVVQEQFWSSNWGHLPCLFLYISLYYWRHTLKVSRGTAAFGRETPWSYKSYCPCMLQILVCFS